MGMSRVVAARSRNTVATTATIHSATALADETVARSVIELRPGQDHLPFVGHHVFSEWPGGNESAPAHYSLAYAFYHRIEDFAWQHETDVAKTPPYYGLGSRTVGAVSCNFYALSTDTSTVVAVRV